MIFIEATMQYEPILHEGIPAPSVPTKIPIMLASFAFSTR